MSLTHFSIPNPLTISSPLSPCLPPSLPNLRWPDMHGHVSLRVGISPLLSPPPSLSHHPSVPRLARTRFFACRYFSSPLYPSLPISPSFGAQTCTDTFLCVLVFLLHFNAYSSDGLVWSGFLDTRENERSFERSHVLFFIPLDSRMFSSKEIIIEWRHLSVVGKSKKGENSMDSLLIKSLIEICPISIQNNAFILLRS